MRVAPAVNYVEPRDAIAHDWLRFLPTLGLMPVLIPNIVDDAGTYAHQLGIQGLILTGGNSLHDETSPPADASRERDRAESSLLSMAIATRLPVLGVCRGLQLINTYYGGTVALNFMGADWHGVAHVATEHRVELVDPEWRQWSGSAQLAVNSFHTDAVTAAGLAPSLRTTALCDGGRIVEGLCHPELPILGVQWHPERPNAAASFDRILFERLFKAGSGCAP